MIYTSNNFKIHPKTRANPYIILLDITSFQPINLPAMEQV